MLCWRPRVLTVIRMFTIFVIYLLVCPPILKLLDVLVTTFSDSDWSRTFRYLELFYLVSVTIFIPLYWIMLFQNMYGNRAVPLFVPKWKSSEELTEDDLTCTICYELMVEPHILRCQHTFCKKCLRQSLPYSRKCPTCQQWTYFSSPETTLHQKVLSWVANNGRESEYEEMVEFKANMKPSKLGYREFLLPFMIAAFDERQPAQPEQPPLRRNVRRRRDTIPNRRPIVHIVDEVEIQNPNQNQNMLQSTRDSGIEFDISQPVVAN